MRQNNDFGYDKFLKKLQAKAKDGGFYRKLLGQQADPVWTYTLPEPLPREEFPQRLAELHAWADFWREGGRRRYGSRLWHVEERNISHKLLGHQQIPGEVVIDSAESVFVLLDQQEQAECFKDIYIATKRRLPMLLDWLVRHYDRIFAQNFYPAFLSIGEFFLAQESSGRFLRELSIAGIDTKFLETHLELVRSLWNELYPEREAGNREELFHVLCLEEMAVPNICVRILDPERSCCGLREFFVSAQQIAALDFPVKRIFITENKVNGYAFPAQKDSMILFGMGYGVLELARRAAWLQNKDVYYWGDLDSNGFDMLSKLRELLPQLKSFLMERAVLEKYVDPVIRDTGNCPVVPQNLTVTEKQAWQLLRQENWRLEQERIPLPEVQAALACL